MSLRHDYYDVLGVLPSAEIIVIRAAYRALAKKYHPDSWMGPKQEAELRMQLLNEAYSILSQESKRQAYDRERTQNREESFDFDSETFRSAFGEAEREHQSDWAVALEYYPDLVDLYNDLKRVSYKLAFAFQSTILFSKNYKDRRAIADSMKREFLERYFGKNEKVLDFAQSLIFAGQREAAKELNRAISVLGDGADARLVIFKVKRKFKIGPEQNVGELARKVIKDAFVVDAEHLVAALGGNVERPESGGSFLFSSSPSLLIVTLNGEKKVFPGEFEFAQWVKKSIAPDYI